MTFEYFLEIHFEKKCQYVYTLRCSVYNGGLEFGSTKGQHYLFLRLNLHNTGAPHRFYLF